jgi:hypothetical protein
MPNIDITVSADLEEMFDLPACSDISLPPPKPITLQLPGGGSLSSFSDLSKGIPTDCAMTFSLLLQLGPFLASIECLVKVLQLIQPLIDVVTSITNPVKLATAVPKFVSAAGPVLKCVASFTPLGLIPFIIDLLNLILKVLNCFLNQMKSVLQILNETGPQIIIAQAAGNTDLFQSLTCAQNNAMTQAQHLTSSLGALGVILDLASDLMQLANVPPITLPTIGAATDLNSLNQVVKTVQTLVVDLQSVVDGLGGSQ